MFTGIVSGLGQVTSLTRHDSGEVNVWLSCLYEDAVLGESIAINGVCLTVVSIEKPGHGKAVLEFFISSETLSCSNLGRLEKGSRVNLERALRLQDRLSGHLVQGHIDGLAKLIGVRPAGESREIQIEVPPRMLPFLVEKGSVALDGISLTINTIKDKSITLRIIPHTWEHTTLSSKQVGQDFNLELDVIAKYVQRLVQTDAYNTRSN
ncbi:MAG: riboflavin synthase [Bdellovibrionota bacterium]